MKLTLGSIALADNVSQKDAIAVQALRKAGAVVYVKTTMPQTGMVCFLPERMDSQDSQNSQTLTHRPLKPRPT